MNNKTIILKKNKDDVFFRYIKNRNTESYYINNNEKFLFKLFRKFKLPLFYIFLGKWKKNLNKINNIIMFDNGFNEMVAKYVKLKNKKIKVILWYWNPVSEYSESFLKCKYIDEIWSYSKSDAQKYNLKYNTQFYSKELKYRKRTIVDDVIFLGNSKDRKNKILEFEKLLKSKAIKTNFKIIEDKKDYIKYDEYIKNIQTSKCILDYNTNNKIAPLTLRPLEALFLNKKLITNNLDIINYDFYNPRNIFILGKDDINDIKKFIDTPYQIVDEKIVNYYDFNSWLQRFFEEEKC